jgi:hypothetical protein
VPVGQPMHPAQVVTQSPVDTNHTFHLIMTFVTCGLWLPVWALMAVLNSLSTKRSVSHYR